jgi:hypothetical protein
MPYAKPAAMTIIKSRIKIREERREKNNINARGGCFKGIFQKYFWFSKLFSQFKRIIIIISKKIFNKNSSNNFISFRIRA